MAAVGSIVINDGQATPASHTFVPESVSTTLVSWSDRSGGIVIGFPRLSMSLRLPSKGADSYKASLKVVVPTLEVTSPSTSTGIQPAPTLAYSNLFSGDFVSPTRSTLGNRNDMLAYAKNFMAHASVTTLIQNFEMPY